MCGSQAALTGFAEMTFQEAGTPYTIDEDGITPENGITINRGFFGEHLPPEPLQCDRLTVDGVTHLGDLGESTTVDPDGWYGQRGNQVAIRFSDVSLAGYMSFTISLWVNFDDDGQDVSIFSYGRFPICGFMVQARIGRAQRDLHIRASPSSSPDSGLEQYNSPTNVIGSENSVHQWAHIAIVKDSNSGKIYYWVNGIPRGHKAYSVTMPTCADNYVELGGWPGDETIKYLHGHIADAKIFSETKNASEIVSLFAEGRCSNKVVQANRFSYHSVGVGKCWDASGNYAAGYTKLSEPNSNPETCYLACLRVYGVNCAGFDTRDKCLAYSSGGQTNKEIVRTSNCDANGHLPKCDNWSGAMCYKVQQYD